MTTTDQGIERLADLALQLTEGHPNDMEPRQEGFIHGVVVALGCLLDTTLEENLQDAIIDWGISGYTNLMIRAKAKAAQEKGGQKK